MGNAICSKRKAQGEQNLENQNLEGLSGLIATADSGGVNVSNILMNNRANEQARKVFVM